MAIVIVGGGHAAGQAAASIRQEGFDDELILIGAEPHIPYQRPPLSKQYLAGEQPLDKVLLRPEKFYVDRTIDLRTGITVENIDRDVSSLHSVTDPWWRTISYCWPPAAAPSDPIYPESTSVGYTRFAALLMSTKSERTWKTLRTWSSSAVDISVLKSHPSRNPKTCK